MMNIESLTFLILPYSVFGLFTTMVLNHNHRDEIYWNIGSMMFAILLWPVFFIKWLVFFAIDAVVDGIGLWLASSRKLR